MTISKTGVVFDFDQTLVELPVDIDGVRRSIEELMREVGLDGPARPLLAVLRKLREEGGDVLYERAETIIRSAEITAAKNVVALPGLQCCLNTLLGRPWGIVTNNSSECVEPALRKLGALSPKVVVGRNNVRDPKPHPEGLLVIRDALSVEKLIFIGDRETDEKAARAASLQGVSVEFVGVGKHYQEASLSDIEKRLRALFEL